MSTSVMIPSAPSAPPTSVSVSEVTSSSITVQWGPLDCIHRNGDITSYLIRYGEVGNGRTQTVNVSGGDVTEYTISGLMPSTAYSVHVATVNSAGTGPYSDHLIANTKGIWRLHAQCTMILHILTRCSITDSCLLIHYISDHLMVTG